MKSGIGTRNAGTKIGKTTKIGTADMLKQAIIVYLQKWCKWSRMDMWVQFNVRSLCHSSSIRALNSHQMDDPSYKVEDN